MNTETKLLYLDNAQQKKCEACITSISVKNNIASITLDQTIFYPQGGGQPSDHGVIKGKSGQIAVTNLIYNNGNPIHQGKIKGALEIGETVTCEIDWNRRYQNMRVHSAGHLVHEAVYELYPHLKPLKGAHGIGHEQYIEYEGSADIDIPKLNIRLIQLIDDDRSIKTEFVSLDELKKRTQFVPENLPTNKPLRVMEIDGFAPVPDGGTQVESTKELEGTEITTVEKVGNVVRVNYVIARSSEQITTPAKGGIAMTADMEVASLKNQALESLAQAKTADDIEKIRIMYLGRKGSVNQLLEQIAILPLEERVSFGTDVNHLKKTLENAITQRLQLLSFAPIKRTFFDPTIPAVKAPVGALHPITKIMHEVEDIFKRFGFSVATGPEVEWDEINFQKLLLGPDHPSRDTQETYYFDEKRLLRVHTSSVQIRYMEKHKPPIRIIAPGRVYRRDNIDATHLPSFHQIEGLLVDDRTTLTDLLGMLEHTARALFGQDRKVRFYGHNFPYTEPSLEVEVFSPGIAKGLALSEVEGKWLEILGCGMVHPQVLENCGIDSKKYQGWAFGMGADRLAMLKYGITDIRQLYGGNLKFLAG